MQIEKTGSMDTVSERSKFYASKSISPRTKKLYETDWHAFVLWSRSTDRQFLPASPETVSAYFAELADRGRRCSTIARKATSISVMHAAAKYPSPCKSEIVGRVLRGIRREHGTAVQKTRPISWFELKKMVSMCDTSIMGRRDAAMLSLGWSGALRRSELIALNCGDIEFTDEGMILQIRKSKSDQEGSGYEIGIPRTGQPICPVEIMSTWFERRTNKGNDSPLFPNLGIASRKLWWVPDGNFLKRLSDRMVSLIVKQYAHFAGLPTKNLSAHSLRRGFATECGAHALPEHLIARHTRHRSMAVLRGYIDRGSIWTDNPLPIIYGIGIRENKSAV
jgi:integrase